MSPARKHILVEDRRGCLRSGVGESPAGATPPHDDSDSFSPSIFRFDRALPARAHRPGWHNTGVARQGIRQFIDLGPGLPTSPSTHEAARAATSGTTVAYVDFDPLVVSHLDALVANGQDGIVVMAAGLRDRDAVLCAPDLAGHIDLSQPVCLVMGAVLHVLEAGAAAELAASYARLLAPGSYVITTVGRGDGEVADRFFSMYRAAASMHSHSLDQFATFFEGLEIVLPVCSSPSNGSRICGTYGPSPSVLARCSWASPRCPVVRCPEF